MIKNFTTIILAMWVGSVLIGKSVETQNKDITNPTLDKIETVETMYMRR